ncbi:MAG TPA: leucyl aminopeptidase [Solirubrobacterales bacterium]|jgi:leucyl aminopeptidase|nr:leucyl aminopeptidase [Solirubrobacterales bacterium]HMU25808.1 leucyl aminopeptidase [Solirubrobacterales bacterium]HMX70924.1 leucyl aminopeptidase [Solirubrobacterales bacterium]HMY24873.1 leucyl aminopeptidase [Solirubrobacterales bacterium]HNA24414.1 leucyl aminopeptidase [Solirubrobacterales bacterium]
MKAYTTDVALSDLDADLVAVGLFEGDGLSEPLGSTAGASDASGDFKSKVIVYPGKPERVVIIGLGPKDGFTLEKARVAGAVAQKALKEVKGEALAWMLPDTGDLDPGGVAACLVEAAIFSAFDFDRYKSGSDGKEAPPSLKAVEINTGKDVAAMVKVGEAVGNAGNRARYLQSLPANVATPEYLAGRAREIAEAHEKVTVEVMDRAAIIKAGMGGLEAVSKGGEHVEPRLITLRYTGKGGGETLGLVGKSVTFDTGGISIKPSAGMHEMKMDMSGGAAVLEGLNAIAELEIPLDIIAVLPATENMPSGTALKPGDIITQLNGKTVEVTNTDAEGRLILADALVHCAREGADRLVDLATLTGAVLIGLGSTYAALISNDDDLAAAVEKAGELSGELVWRLPLHDEYKDLTKGEITDLVNASAQRKAGTIYAGSFLEEFTEGKPWAHLDIAGTAWDTGREYWGKGPTGFGVHLLVALAYDLSS